MTGEFSMLRPRYGRVRAVEFNQKLSDPSSWTKLAYRIIWNGGYQTGPVGPSG
jgi:hypothetical protein